MQKSIFAVLSLSCLLAMSSGAYANEGAKKEEAAGPQYVPLEAVLVNLEGRRHYLRADIQVLVNEAETAEKIKTHMPAIRHALIMLFSGHTVEQMSDMGEREKLRQSAKEAVVHVLEEHHAAKGLEDLFFTDFMVQ